jgi:hypothetical protein
MVFGVVIVVVAVLVGLAIAISQRERDTEERRVGTRRFGTCVLQDGVLRFHDARATPSRARLTRAPVPVVEEALAHALDAAFTADAPEVNATRLDRAALQQALRVDLVVDIGERRVEIVVVE